MAKGCKICHALTPELDATGRCLGCALVLEAQTRKVSYGKLVLLKGLYAPVTAIEEIEPPEPELGEETRLCQWCGKSFPPRGTTARYCSDPCRKEAHKALMRNRNREKRKLTGKRFCAVCGKELPEDAHWNLKTCSEECGYIHRQNVRRANNARYRERKAAANG